MSKKYVEEKAFLSDQEIRKRLSERVWQQKMLMEHKAKRETLYFGSILPIYSYEKHSKQGDGRLHWEPANIYGFSNDKWVKVLPDDFEKYGVTEEDVSQYLGKETQLNDHLLGDDTYALRMAMVLMDEGESFDTLKDIYDKIHAVFAMGYDHTWESIIKHFPSLKERFEKKRPERKKISERLFGEYNEEYERLVQSVKIKSIERIPENFNKNTFDYIQVEVRLSVLLPMETKKTLCKKYIKSIGKHVLTVLSESSKFLKFGVPTNILKVEKATLGRDATLYITLGVKEKTEKEGGKLIMDKENESQDYVMAPENATEDTFVVMEKLLAFFRYTELRMRSRMLIFLAIAVGSIIACCVSVWSVRSLYETGHISQGISIALTGILVMDGVVVAGGSLARHAKINDKYETMRQIIETDGIPITKQMENDYQANRPSLINMGPYKLRINWHEDYYKKCGFNPEF